MTAKHTVKRRNLHFKGYLGNQIAASLDYPATQEPARYAIMCHCFTCTRQTLTTARVSRGLAEAGIAVLRFDFSGLGESAGEFADTHFRSMLADIQAAAQLLQQHYRPASILLGHSMGGTACLAASQLPDRCFSELDRLVTLASPASPDHVLRHFGQAMGDLEQGKSSYISVAGQDYPVKPAFIEDVRSYDMAQQMANCELPIMAVRAGNDGMVGAEQADRILDYTQAQRNLCEISGADHLFSERKHTQQLIEQIVDWL